LRDWNDIGCRNSGMRERERAKKVISFKGEPGENVIK
jgi:hypothetical protein